MVSPATLVGLLGEDERLRVVAALALGASTAEDVLAATGLSPREVGAALRRLESGGLVSSGDGHLQLNAGVFKQAARAAAPDDPPEDFGATDPKVTAVLRAFIRGGRLVQVPTTASKRLVVLEYIASVFEPGVRYPEREVNAILSSWYDDYASLRRYLVDSDLMAREAGEYWRVGGWVDVARGARPAEPAAVVQSPVDEPVVDQVAAEQAVVEDAVEEADRGADWAAGQAGVVRESRLGAYALVRDGDRVLLSRFAGSGGLGGVWSAPGGGVEFGESPAEAVVREVYEETGLHVRVTDLLDVTSVVHEFERGGRPVRAHHVQVLYRAEVTGGTLGVVEVDGSTDAARWWRPAELTPDTRLTRYARAMLARW